MSWRKGRDSVNKTTNNFAVISAVLGVLGIIGMLPLIGSIGAIVLGHMARGQIAQDPGQDGDGYATLGLVTGYLGVGLACLGVIAVVVWFGGMAAFLAFVGIAGAAAGA